MGDALTAEGAVAVLEIAADSHIQRGAGAGAYHIPDVHSLNLVAGLNTAHTLNALAGFTDHGNVHFQMAPFRLHRVGLIMDVQIVGQTLQFAVSAADAGGEGGIVLG